METIQVQALFREFASNFDSVHSDSVWERQQQIFKRFWKEKILSPNNELKSADTDAVVRLLDTKARGHQKTDEAVAQTGVRQGVLGAAV
jgi:hypothetical protein